MEYLVVMEVSQKQRYIFSTNRLKENVGASIIIREITEKIPEKFLDDQEKQFFFAGGGKSIYIFETEERGKKFIHDVSTKVLKEYPGIELFMTIHGYDNTKESIVCAVDELYAKLEKKKSLRRAYFVYRGAGITEQCVDTQLPAEHKDEKNGKFYSAESYIKLRKSEEKERSYFEERLLPEDSPYCFAKEEDEFGNTQDKKSYLAVIAIDGNKMGKRIERFREAHKTDRPDEEFNEQYKKKFREFSKRIDDAFTDAVKKAISELVDRLPKYYEDGVLTKPGKENVIPVRPLVLSGDDICIMTDARIGIYLAKTILQKIEESPEFEAEGDILHGCAGIAMVKSHYPFFRAHELAEELCSNAKSILPSDGDKDESVIDFHIVEGEIEGSISEIRAMKYRHNEEILTNKPLYLREGEDGRTNSIPNFEARLNHFRKEDSFGKGFVKEYRAALRKGKREADKYLTYHRHTEDVEGSFDENYCVDLDVIEMLDIYPGEELQ